MNHLQKTKKAACRIEGRTPLDDAYNLVCHAKRRAREHLADELDGLLSEDWIDDAAVTIAHGAAFEQVELAGEYSEGESTFVASRTYGVMHAQIGLSKLEGIISLTLYEGTIVPACDEALRIASAVIKDAIMQAALECA